MGFLDKLKSIGRGITGGGASVQLRVGQAALGAPIPVVVTAHIEGAAIKASKIYVAVRAVETVDLVHRDRDGGGNDRDRVHQTEVTFSQEFVIHGPVELPPNSQHEWRGEVMLPTGAPPSYRGKNARHEWSVLAALDVSGNDPDSGWTEIQVR
jgi:hypothetical protein